jgi:hypothetical protein
MTADERTRQIAHAFAQALLDGHFEDAHAMLAGKARSSWTPATLAARYAEMIAYFETPPTEVAVMMMLEQWPAKENGDLFAAASAHAMARNSSSSPATSVVAPSR